MTIERSSLRGANFRFCGKLCEPFCPLAINTALFPDVRVSDNWKIWLQNQGESDIERDPRSRVGKIKRNWHLRLRPSKTRIWLDETRNPTQLRDWTAPLLDRLDFTNTNRYGSFFIFFIHSISRFEKKIKVNWRVLHDSVTTAVQCTDPCTSNLHTVSPIEPFPHQPDRGRGGARASALLHFPPFNPSTAWASCDTLLPLTPWLIQSLLCI